MNADFPRILSLLRRERGLSQKQVAEALGVSQALLSHYEKGIRECGLDFLRRCADFYGVSCDYLLGRSADKTGSMLTVDDLPDPDALGKEQVQRGALLPVLNKKLLVNSLQVLFDLLAKCGSKGLVHELSAFLMLSVYRAFRVLYSANPKNQQNLFALPVHMQDGYAEAAQRVALTNAAAVAAGEKVGDYEPLEEVAPLAMSSETIAENYPLFAASLLNLIKNAEARAKG